MLRPSLQDYGDANIFVKRTITVPDTAVAGADSDNRNKEVITALYLVIA